MKSLIHTCLWFDHQAEEAAAFYVSVFPHSSLGTVTRYGPGAPMPEGSVLTVSFELDGRPWTALNGGPVFSFTPAVSFVVNCQTQQEVDRYWAALAADPTQGQCGWLTDGFGVSWQIVPQQLMDMQQHADAARKARMMAALMTMKKIDIAALQQAFGHP